MAKPNDNSRTLLEAAVARHRAGDLVEAGAAYLDILAVAPRQPDALHLLGLVFCQRGEPAKAVGFLRQASQAAPAEAAYRVSLGTALLEAGQPQAAAASLAEAVALAPEHGEALRLLGNAQRLSGRAAEAEAALRRAAALRPHDARTLNDLGSALRERASLGDAIGSYRAAIDADPGFAPAWNNLGCALLLDRRGAEGIEALARAVAIAPNHGAAWKNLVLAEFDAGRPDAAAESCRQWLASDPGSVDAVVMRAGLFCERGEHLQAIALVDQALADRPADVELLVMLAVACLDAGRGEEVVTTLRQAIATAPDRFRNAGRLGMVVPAPDGTMPADASGKLVPIEESIDGIVAMVTELGLGTVEHVVRREPRMESDFLVMAAALGKSGNSAAAAEVYRALLRADPQNPIAGHMLAASTGEDTLPRASDAYVTGLFDNYAEQFDTKLGHLQYRAPELAASCLKSALTAGEAGLDILDAGCGTGLCGPLLRPVARRLVGVDLSPGMLAKARERGAYDELVTAELGEFLARCEARYDAVVSTDVLIYFGRLEQVFGGVARILRPGGRFVFTVEHLAAGDAAGEVKLNLHGRYSHGERYTRDALAAAGFAEIAIERATLRMEGWMPVEGLVIRATRGGA